MRAPFLRASTTTWASACAIGPVALAVLVGGQGDHRQRSEEALRRGPLQRPGGACASGWRGTRPAGCAGRGGAATWSAAPLADRVHRQRDRARDLAEALEPGGVARVDAEPLGQPVGGHRADPVLGGVIARGREQAPGDEPVDLPRPSARRRRSPGAPCRRRARRATAAACRSMGLWAYPTMATWLRSDHRLTVARLSSVKAGTATPAARSSKAARTGRPRAAARRARRAGDR